MLLAKLINSRVSYEVTWGSRVCVRGKGRCLCYLYCFVLAFVIVGEFIYIRCVGSHFVSLLFKLTSVECLTPT